MKATTPRARRADGRPAPGAEENVHAVVYRVLRWGMLASTALFAIGIVLALVRPGAGAPLVGAAPSPHDLAWFAQGMARLDPAAIMMAATVLLILTPVARVLGSIYAFAVDRDARYVIVTSAVLVVMGATVVAGLLGLAR